MTNWPLKNISFIQNETLRNIPTGPRYIHLHWSEDNAMAACYDDNYTIMFHPQLKMILEEEN